MTIDQLGLALYYEMCTYWSILGFNSACGRNDAVQAGIAAGHYAAASTQLTRSWNACFGITDTAPAVPTTMVMLNDARSDFQGEGARILTYIGLYEGVIKEIHDMLFKAVDGADADPEWDGGVL